MKSICYILIFLLLVLLLWNLLLKTKEPLDMNVNDDARCLDRHQKRNDNNLKRITKDINSFKSKSKTTKILNDLLTDQKNSEREIKGLLSVAKGENPEEQDPKACDKHPEAC